MEKSMKAPRPTRGHAIREFFQFLGKPSLMQEGNVASSPIMSENLQQLAFCRNLAAIFAGIGAGLLRIQGLGGLLIFLCLTFVGSFSVLLKIKFRAQDYFYSLGTVLASSLFSGFLTFIIIWILVYNVLYVF
ncbi:hypothetical protein IE077_002700 [Cardiosporidium cionae]|uniref:ER membrane protein complex subunit 6 n=1 Tax=Cardiosporidium cionae TaxID=476202 RepID=A0ABQ7JFP4_9APIC|nr:hypothetical protein IE077_002700 [Cardiosporidium cionae]|eukprot:KAF8822769.1 hypothetical protein IE077_002700 [Cardiosporidium cionae]